MEKNQKPKKTAFERIKGLKFFKKSKICFVLKPKNREYFEKLFEFLKPKQKKEILAEMSKFEATTGEWKFLAEKFKSEHLKKFAFKMFKEVAAEAITEVSVEIDQFVDRIDLGDPEERKVNFFNKFFARMKKKSA
ncbi:MAG: hypothetical protein R3B60_04690 [Candidatus Paceibacterota bacterium]